MITSALADYETMGYTERFLLLVCCVLAIATAALDDDMGLRVFNAADGKTLCEVKLKDYVESGHFSCEYYCMDLQHVRRIQRDV